MICVKVISLDLPRNKELLELQSEFESMTIFPAIRADSIKNRLRNRYPKFNGSNYLSEAEYACTKSHSMALNEFLLEKQHQYCVILEDDVYLKGSPNKVAQRIKKICDQMQDEASIVHCGGMDGMKFDKYFKLRRLITSSGISILEAKVLYRACAYLVTRKSARILHEYLSQMPPVVADNWFDLKRTSNVTIKIENFFNHPLNLDDSSIEIGRHGR